MQDGVFHLGLSSMQRPSQADLTEEDDSATKPGGKVRPGLSPASVGGPRRAWGTNGNEMRLLELQR